MIDNGSEKLTKSITLYCGDCLDVLPTLAENSIDAIVTDSPYGLEFMGKEWDSFGKAPTGGATFTRDGMGKGFKALPSFNGTPNHNCLNCGGSQRGQDRKGFTRCRCDSPSFPNVKLKQMTAFQDWCESWARECLRVLKPGGHLLAFGGTRTYHRLVCAIEDAGFEIRDQIQWLYGSGFPKSHDVSKGIDKAAGVEREVVATGSPVRWMIPGADQHKHGWEKNNGRVYQPNESAPATEAARQWHGWGTALKPANEPICLARKPLSEKTVTANVLRWGTGAINVDGCRVGSGSTQMPPARGREGEPSANKRYTNSGSTNFAATPGPRGGDATGRWPANVLHDGSDEVVGAFPESGGQHGIVRGSEPSECHNNVHSGPRKREGFEYEPRGDTGSAARFFYCAKANKAERACSKHPTVKPLALMRYLCRLIVPPGGVVLDPFAGTGTVGEAAIQEGFRAVLIERETEYQADIRRRIGLATVGPSLRRAYERAYERSRG